MKQFFTLVSIDRGATLADGTDRAAALKQFRAGERPGVRFSATVYGEGPNKNHTILNPAELEAFAGSFVGQPFLQNHSRYQSDRGGTIVASKLETDGDRRVIRQTIEAVKPWAVESVLDGTIDRFSIGWNAEEYLCTVCGTSFFDEDEKHSPWDLGRTDRKSGKVVQCLMKGLEGAEVSAVTHPAVAGTRIDEVLQQLSEQRASGGSGIRPGRTEGKSEVPMKEKVCALLGLAADTAEPEALAALEKRLSSPKTVLPAGLLSALDLGAEGTENEAIARVHAIKAVTVSREVHDKTVADLAEERATRLVRKYEDAGKVTPAMRDWALSTAKKDAAEFERLMADFPVVRPALEQPNPAEKTAAKVDANGLTEEDDRNRLEAGLSVDEWKKGAAAYERTRRQAK